MRHNLKSQNPIQLLSTLPNPYQARPAPAPSPYYAPTVPSASEFTPSPSSSNVTIALPPSSLPPPAAHPVESVVLLMLLLTRRWFGAYFSLGSVGWLWHQNVLSRDSPDNWSAGEYAGADKALNGWDAAICKGIGLCRNKFGSSVHVEKEEMRKGEMECTPDFVLDYAPYVYLYSQERFLPGDIGEHLRHTIPYLNYSLITSYNNHQSLKNLAELNQFGTNVYLTSDDDPEHPPEWLRGDRNKPISPGSGDNDLLGMSAAPGIIIWVEKGEGIVDAFYFYFYSFNLGNKVAGWRFGNHVGDWEHNAVRFVNGQPESVFYSEHSGGAAYEYQAVEKIGLRPVSYSARGSHANYARPGVHYYAIPFHLLADVTDKGTLWDVTKNSYIYKWNMTSDVLTASRETPLAPVEWFHYEGRWGDRFYPLSDRRQYRVAGQYHYVNGPTGPKFKNLDRKEICQNEGICVVQPSLTVKLEGVNGGKWDEEDIPWPGDSKEETDVEGADGYDFGGDYAGEAGVEID